MTRSLKFDGTEKHADRFAALYNAFLTGIVLSVQAREKSRTMADARLEAAIQDKLDAVSEPSSKGTSCGEPMRELREGPQSLALTQDEHKAVCDRVEVALPRLGPSQQRGALDALAFFDAAEKVDGQ